MNAPTPTVHMNGTSRKSLQEQCLNAAMAIRGAMEAFNAMAPHGRDYYPQGPEAYHEARKWMDARMGQMRDLYKEIEQMHNHIDGHS